METWLKFYLVLCLQQRITCSVITVKPRNLVTYFQTTIVHNKVKSTNLNRPIIQLPYRTYSIPGKTADLVPEFVVKDLPSAELQPRFLRLQWRTWAWAEHSWWWLKIYTYREPKWWKGNLVVAIALQTKVDAWFFLITKEKLWKLSYLEHSDFVSSHYCATALNL